MGECSLHLVQAPNFGLDSTLALTIDIRTKIRYQYSFIESAVVKIGNNTLEVSGFGQYILDSVSNCDLSDGIAGFPISHFHPSENVHLFEIDITGEEKLVFRTFKDMVSVKIDRAEAKRFHGSGGMMGNYETGKLLGRDGQTLISDPVAFAAEWQVRNDEPMLFQTASGPQYPEVCKLPNPAKTGRRLGKAVNENTARKACASWTDETRDGCIHDVLATGDIGLAAVGSF